MLAQRSGMSKAKPRPHNASRHQSTTASPYLAGICIGTALSVIDRDKPYHERIIFSSLGRMLVRTRVSVSRSTVQVRRWRTLGCVRTCVLDHDRSSS